MKVLILLLCASLGSGGGIDLPSYIEKCSLSNPQLNECIKTNANKAIPIIAKGDIFFGIPTLSPVSFTTAPLRCTNLSIIAMDTYMDNFKDLRITRVMFDLPNRKIELSAVFDRIEATAKNYTVISGEFIGVQAQGHGKFNMTIIKTVIDFKADIGIFKKAGDEYMNLINRVVDANLERGYYYFENLKSSGIDDMNAYIEEHWKEFREQMKGDIC